MCNGFGLIVTRDAQYFIEPDDDGEVSHSDILARLGWQDSKDAFARKFIRVEYATWKADSFKVDERTTLPGWVDEAEVKQRCDKVLAKVATAWAEYEKVRDTAYAEYEKVCDTAYAEYQMVRAPAYAKYQKVCGTAMAEYEKVGDAARAEMVAKMSKVRGYVPESEASK